MYVSSYSICIFLILTLDNHIRMIKKNSLFDFRRKKNKETERRKKLCNNRMQVENRREKIQTRTKVLLLQILSTVFPHFFGQ